MRLMGLDVGDRRIGVAVNDLLGLMAQPLETWTRQEIAQDLEHFCKQAQQLSITRFICGLPRNMNGTYGPQCEKTKEFMQALCEASGIPVVYVDERLTSRMAEQVLRGKKMQRTQKREATDMIAAMQILQTYMDSNKES